MTGPAWGRPLGRLWRVALDRLPQPVVPGMAVDFAAVSAAGAVVLGRAMGDPTGQVAAARLAAGRRGFTGWAQGHLAAYGWVSFDDEPIGEHGLTLHLHPGEAYLWDFVTLPAFRGQRLYTALLSHSVAVLAREGWRSAWIGANLDNEPSCRGIQRAGFIAVADLFVAEDDAGRRFSVQGLPGAPPAWVEAARWALLG